MKHSTLIYNSIVNNFFINRWIFKYKCFHCFYVLLALAILFTRTILFFIEILTNFDPKSVDSFFLSYLISTVWLLYAVSETIIYPSANFIKSFDAIWSQLSFSNEPDVIEELKKAQKLANFSSILLFTSGSILTFTNGTFDFLSTSFNNNLEKYYFLCNISIEIYSHLIFLNLFRGFLIAGSYIKIGHRCVHSQIAGTIQDACASVSTIYRLRCQHYDLVRCGGLCDLAFGRFVTACCSVFVPNSILILYNLVYKNLDLKFKIVNVAAFLQYLISISLFFPCLLGFHSSPGLALDDLYASTLVKRSNFFKSEALIFMDLLNQQSCGIKFMGIFLITPDIIPNLATIVFTYLMAIPNFIVSNKQQ